MGSKSTYTAEDLDLQRVVYGHLQERAIEPRGTSSKELDTLLGIDPLKIREILNQLTARHLCWGHYEITAPNPTWRWWRVDQSDYSPWLKPGASTD